MSEIYVDGFELDLIHQIDRLRAEVDRLYRFAVTDPDLTRDEARALEPGRTAADTRAIDVWNRTDRLRGANAEIATLRAGRADAEAQFDRLAAAIGHHRDGSEDERSRLVGSALNLIGLNVEFGAELQIECERLRAEVETLRARNAELEGPAQPDYGPPADPGCDPAMVEAALLLVDDDAPPLAVIASWTPEQRRAVAEWARREHLHASDNPAVARLPRPDFLPPAPGWGQTRSTR